MEHNSALTSVSLQATDSMPRVAVEQVTPGHVLRPHMSVVTSLYKSEPFLECFLDECLDALKAVGCESYELIFVNDGSPDRSAEAVLKLKEHCPQIVLVDLSRNFGHHYALSAGLMHSSGEYVFIIDCDLEVRPRVLVDFYHLIRNSDYDVVFGYQKTRKGGWFEKISGGIYWRLFNLLSDTKIPVNMTSERLMTRRYVDALLEMGDKNLFLAGMMSWVGFKQKGVPVLKVQRQGRSTYTLLRRINLLIMSITSFTAYPLTVIFTIGILTTLLSFLYSGMLIIQKLLFPERVLLGWASLMALVCFGFGIVVMCLGLIGIYLAKIFNQVQNRPTYIVCRIIR